MNSIARLNKLAKALSVFGVGLVIAPYIYAFIAVGTSGIWEVLFSCALPFILIPLGYLMQSAVGRLLKTERIKDSFDDKVKFVDMRGAIIPIIISVAAFFPIHILYRDHIMLLDPLADALSLSFYTVPLFCTASLISGVLMWFYPYSKLMNADMVYFYGGLFLVVSIISAIFLVNSLLLTLCFILFMPVFFTVSNLKSIEESISASKFRIPENNFRRYNFELIIKFYFKLLFIALLIFSLTVLAVSAISGVDLNLEPMDTRDSEVTYRDGGKSNSMTLGKLLFNITGGQGQASPLVIICSVLSAVLIIALILRWIYKKHLLKKFFYMLSLFFSAIKGLFYGLFGLLYSRARETEPIAQSYIDSPIDPECVIRYVKYTPKKLLDLATFNEELKAKQSLEEKYAYAYTVYTSLITGHKYGIKPSDTPRVLTAKLKAQHREELTEATPIYEDIRYRIKPPHKGLCEEELKNLISHIRQIL